MGIKGRDITGFLKRDFLLAFKSSVILALLYLFCIPIIRGVKNLDSIQSAQCLEQSVSLIGIILFVPVTRWEHSLGIKELIVSDFNVFSVGLPLLLCTKKRGNFSIMEKQV